MYSHLIENVDLGWVGGFKLEGAIWGRLVGQHLKTVKIIWRVNVVYVFGGKHKLLWDIVWFYDNFFKCWSGMGVGLLQGDTLIS